MLFRFAFPSLLVHVRDLVVRAVAWEVLIRDGCDRGAVPISLDLLRCASIAGLGAGCVGKKRGCYR